MGHPAPYQSVGRELNREYGRAYGQLRRMGIASRALAKVHD